ncbi:hypothetical protein H072_6699 [Dactylellina haptotyla CBS 200.50]|uniref:F-box domain-containing protein n=1 Tax=Dactylellina haptotyla (strain CBS 200.50) TaxID=1284197 RepID=S8BJU3_DACHA|nr:hypothetical protein H072_6699 [Dactylellina haptotyla CBS 200.50]
MGRRRQKGCCWGLFDCFSFLFRKPPVGGEKLLDHPEIIAGILSHLPEKQLLGKIKLVHPVFYDIATTSNHAGVQWKTWAWAHPTIPPTISIRNAYTQNIGHEYAYNPPRPSREISALLLPVINKLWLRICDDVKRAHDELGFKPGKEKDYTPLLDNGNYSGLDDLVGDPPHDIDWYLEKQLLADMPHTISNMQVARPALVEPVNITMRCFRCCSRTCHYTVSFASPPEGLRMKDFVTMLVHGLFDWDHGACSQCLWNHNSTHCAVAMEVNGVVDEIGEGRVWYDYVGGRQVGEEARGTFNILSLSLYAEGGGKTWGRGGEFQSKQMTV